MSADRVFHLERYDRRQLWGVSGISSAVPRVIKEQPVNTPSIFMKPQSRIINFKGLRADPTTIIAKAIRNARVYYSSECPYSAEEGKALYSPLDIAFRMREAIDIAKDAEQPEQIAALFSEKDRNPINKFAFGIVYEKINDSYSTSPRYEKRPVDLIQMCTSQIFLVARQMQKEDCLLRSVFSELPENISY